MLDQIVTPYYSAMQAVERIRELGATYGGHTLECWTKSRPLFAETLKTFGIAGRLKHEEETNETKRVISEITEILTDLYNIKPIKPKPILPKWRKGLFFMVKKLENVITGGGKYEI